MKKKDEWRRRARCLGMDPRVFVLPDHTHLKRVGSDPYAAARAVCAGCPVRTECREDAIATQEFHGFRGGLEPGELRYLAERRRARNDDHTRGSPDGSRW